MSETMSSGEIEDVLSSIRQLVSEDLRPDTSAAENPGPDGKLLLTPALRVIPPAPATPLSQGDEDWLPEAAGDVTDTGLTQAELTRVVAEIGARVVPGLEAWEAEMDDAPVSSGLRQAPDWVEAAEVAEDSIEAAQRDAVARAFAEKAEAAAVAKINSRMGEAKAEEDALPADQGHFDEAVLLDLVRDLVRDVIREELRGDLGAQITRNMRKLIHAEINRALTVRDFDR